jgi:hypothetical protein
MRTFKASITAAGLMALLAVPAAAQWSFQADTMSRYVWRGFDLFAPNHAAFQPSAAYTFGSSGFSANAWASFALSGRETYRTADEIDLTLAYALSTAEEFSLSVGLTHYGWYFGRDFTLKSGTTQEIFLTAALPKAVLRPALSLFWDVNLGSGIYACLKIGQEIKLAGTLALSLTAALGYNHRQWIAAGGFSDLTLGISLPIKAGPVTIAPLVNWTVVLMSEVNPDNELWFGLSMIL